MGAVQEVIGKNTINSVYFWGTKPQPSRKRSMPINDSMTMRMRNRASTSYDEDSGVSDVEMVRNSHSAQHNESSGFLDARSSRSDNSRSSSGKESRKSVSASTSRKCAPEGRKSIA